MLVATRPSQELRVTAVDTERAFEELRVEWTRLLLESSGDTVFLTWEWAAAWWGTYGSDKELYILKVEDDGRLIGLAPLYRASRRLLGVLPYRTLRFIGDGSWDSDYLDFIAAAGRERRVVHAIARFLLDHHRHWDVLSLNEVPRSSVNLEVLRERLKNDTRFWRETERGCTYVPLPSDWDGYLRGLKPRMRTKIRSLTARLEHGFSVTFDCCQRPDELPERLESLFDLHALRWQGKSHDGVFVSPAKRQFYREVARRFLPVGWLRLYSLMVDGRYVAHQYCLEYQHRLFLLQEGFDPRWEGWGVGNVLRAYVFRDCIDRKVVGYDFLAGITPHKLSWGGQPKTNVRVTAALGNVRARLLFGFQRSRELTIRVLKSVLPKALIAIMRRANTAPAAA